MGGNARRLYGIEPKTFVSEEPDPIERPDWFPGGPELDEWADLVAHPRRNAEALSSVGLPATVVPEEYVAEGLARALATLVRPGQRVLLARAAETRDLLVRELERLGARVEEVAAYRTRPAAENVAELKQALGAGVVDAVTFTSSSTVRHFVSIFAPGELERLMAGVTVACIGPVTRATAAAAGLEPEIVAEEYTIAGLAAALEKHYKSKGAPRQ